MFTLPELPYPADALAPVLSGLTMRTHHDKHHAKYVETTNKLLGDAASRAGSLEDVVRGAAQEKNQKLFNNAAQAWNHGFFWECMTPQPGRPGAALAEALERGFGGLDAFRAKFIGEGANHFASGWVWLVARGTELEVISTHDGDSAVVREGVTPILTCDLWEHAYYLDHKNDRQGFLDQWFDRLINWDFVSAQYAAATGQGDGYRYPAPTAAAA